MTRKINDIELYIKKLRKRWANLFVRASRRFQRLRSSGNEKACRAVGNANNKNPIAIIVPCHRVVGSDGSMTGYAGGLNIKEKLLKIEKCSV